MMEVFTYKKYLQIIPKETKKFIGLLIPFLYCNDCSIGNHRFELSEDRLFFKALRAYRKTSEANGNILNSSGFKDDTKIDSFNLSEETATSIFTKYYGAFTPFEKEEEYLTITPEDIINNIYYHHMPSSDSTYTTCSLISTNTSSFISRLNEFGEKKKETIKEELSKEFNSSFRISVINYMDMVGRIFTYLKENKDKLENVDTSIDSLKTLAMLLAFFKYNHVSAYKGNFNDKQLIVDFLEKIGLDCTAIENKIDFRIDDDDLKRIDPTVALSLYFKDITALFEPNSINSVAEIAIKLFKNNFETDNLKREIYIRKILGLFDLTQSEAQRIENVLKEQSADSKEVKIDDLYKGLVPAVIKYLKQVSKIYNYLISKKETIDQSLVTSEKSLFVLSVLISSYDTDNSLAEFLKDKGVSLNEILALLNLPSKEEFLSEVEKMTPNETALTKNSTLILKGINEEKPRDAITINSIIDNIKSKERTDTSIIQTIYRAITKQQLSDDFDKQIKTHLSEKNSKRKRALTEEMLKDIPIDVFEFLKILTSYYKILSPLKLDQVDLEQLSIINAATRANKDIEKYLGSFGIDRTTLANAFEIDFSYSKKPFDIDIIKEHFMSYVFDRPNPEITVYSIFENAFKPELTNTLNLRRVLSQFDKEPEDFIGIEDKIKEQAEAKKQKELNASINELYNKCDEPSKKIICDAILISDLLSANKDKLKQIETEEDLIDISLLMSILINDVDRRPYFAKNGINLAAILTGIDFCKNISEEIKKVPFDRNKILKYKNYLNKDSITTSTLVNSLFSYKVNPSKLLENITTSTGNSYEYLVDEVSKMKEREPDPNQGIKLLTSIEVEEIEDPSFTSIVDFGLGISKHSKYINNALTQIATADTLDRSMDGINVLLEEVASEEVVAAPKKTFLGKFFGSGEQQQKTIKKYNPEKIGELQEQVEEQIMTLSKELKGYELIKKYMELFLKKLYDHLQYLKDYYASFEEQPEETDLDEIEKFTKTLDRNSGREILRDKINTFETMILLMKQELITVHHSIINHFIAINSLQTSKSAILPLLTTEIALSVGRESEREALELAGGLVKLFGSVVNGNAAETKANLERLKLTSISEETYTAMSKEVNSYLESLDRGQKLLTPQIAPNIPLIKI